MLPSSVICALVLATSRKVPAIASPPTRRCRHFATVLQQRHDGLTRNASSSGRGRRHGCGHLHCPEETEVNAVLRSPDIGIEIVDVDMRSVLAPVDFYVSI